MHRGLAIAMILLYFTGCDFGNLPRRDLTPSKVDGQTTIFISKIQPFANFRELHAAGIPFRSAILWGSDFTGAQLPRTDFRFADLTEVSFRGANLRGAIFNGAILNGAIFDDADLRGAIFNGAFLWNTSFKKISCDVQTRGISCP